MLRGPGRSASSTAPRSASATRCWQALKAEDPALNVGWNEPYSARNGVTFTLEHHGDGRGLDCTMIEIRHDEILEPAGVTLWADRLARTLEIARGAISGMPVSVGQLNASRPGGTNG